MPPNLLCGANINSKPRHLKETKKIEILELLKPLARLLAFQIAIVLFRLKTRITTKQKKKGFNISSSPCVSFCFLIVLKNPLLRELCRNLTGRHLNQPHAGRRYRFFTCVTSALLHAVLTSVAL
jgi:hypothetical protein